MVIRWQPFQEIETMRRYLDRAFDEANALKTEQTSEVRSSWTPVTELSDRGDNLTLRVFLPGIESKDLDIQVTRESVTIAGDRPFHKESESDRYFWSEIRYGKFHRAIDLPVPVQHDGVRADYSNGILTLTLPKLEKASNKVFKVSINGVAETESENTPKSPEA